MTEPADMIVPLLREMRAENLAQHEQRRALLRRLVAGTCLRTEKS